MDTKTRARFEFQARIVKALAHPTRLFLVHALSQGERCVCELAEEAGADMSTVSKHLALLKSGGLVEDDKRGLQVYYRLRVPCVVDFFECIEAVVAANVQAQLELLKKDG